MALDRVQSSLSDELELLVQQTIGCCLEVHRCLGPGLGERLYHEACVIELHSRGLAFERERRIAIRYKDRFLSHQRIDLLVDSRLILEVKSVDRLHPVHVAQVVGYLRLIELRVGLVVNFNVELLKHGIRRVVLQGA